jgi:hypothetical protein
MSLTHRARSENFRSSCIERRRTRHTVSLHGIRPFPEERVFGTTGVTACKGQWARVRESAMKPVGKPDAGNPHVRFDERGLGNGTAIRVSTRAQPRLYRCPS